METEPWKPQTKVVHPARCCQMCTGGRGRKMGKFPPKDIKRVEVRDKLQNFLGRKVGQVLGSERTHVGCQNNPN